jgi:hypothetical protein
MTLRRNMPDLCAALHNIWALRLLDPCYHARVDRAIRLRSQNGAMTMADKSQELNWINFTADDLTPEQREAFDMMLEARKAFEATFPCRDGFTLRFSYKGADFTRMGLCEIAAPKSREAVKQSLADWLASKRATGSRT